MGKAFEQARIISVSVDRSSVVKQPRNSSFDPPSFASATGGLSVSAEFVGRIHFNQVCQYKHEAQTDTSTKRERVNGSHTC